MIPESAITRTVMQHWRALALPNTLVAGIPNMRAHGQYGLTPGLPDLLVMGPGLPVGFIELKTERGRPTETQIWFRDLCAQLHAPHAITYGLDHPIAMLETWKIVRGAR